MTITAASVRPRPSTGQIHDLIQFLAANVDVENAEGKPLKAAQFAAFQRTVEGLADHAPDMSKVSTVEIVNRDGFQLEKVWLYSQNSTLEVLDGGATLRVVPAPRPEA